MKQYLVLLAVTLSLNFATYCQKTDTICLPIEIAQRAAIAVEQRKILVEKVSLLEQRIAEHEEMIADLKSKDLNNDRIVLTYQSEIQLMKDQRIILENQIKEYVAEIKRLKRKTFWTSVAGIAVAVGIIYLTK